MRARAIGLGGLIVSTTLMLLSARVLADTAPDGWVIFASNRADARTEIYRARADGSGVQRLTNLGGTFPSISRDGRWINYRNDAEPGQTFFVRPDGSENQAKPGFPLFWLHDNRGFAILEAGVAYAHDLDTGDKTLLFNVNDFPEFAGSSFDPYAMTHDNRYLAIGSDLYLNGFTGANGTFKQGYSAILVDLLDTKKIYMFGNGCWAFTPPTGNFVYHIRRDDNGDNPSWPDIYRLDLADLATRRSYAPEVANPDADWGHEYHPHISNDNQWLIYMTSNGCHWDYSCNNEIFLHRLGTGTSDRIRVTEDPSFDGFPDLFVGPMWQKSSQPQLATAPRQVTFFARAATMPEGQTIRIKNIGGGDLGEATAMFDPPVRWADLVTTRTAITVTPRAGTVTRGRHEATIALHTTGAPGAPLLIPVTLQADDTFPVEEPLEPDAGVDAEPAGAAGPDEVDAAADPTTTTPATRTRGGCSTNPSGGDPASLAMWSVAILWFGLRGSRRRARGNPARS